MSVMDLDRPLDDVIAERRKKTRSQGIARRGGKAGHVGPYRTARPHVTHTFVSTAKAPANNLLQLPAQVGGSKIIVSNLPADVTEIQIRELFSSTVGPVLRVVASYDNRGQSKGQAQVEFKRGDDAAKAFQQYNKRLIDQSRPMKVEVIIDPSRMPPPPLTTRVGPAPTVVSAATAGSKATLAATGGIGKRTRAKKTKAKPKTAAELDAEMEDYTKAKGA